MRRPIVILGGMGPQASLRLHELLLEKSRAYHNGDGGDYPHIVHFSLPVPDFISNESHKVTALATLDKLTPAITAMQPEQILLACNTAHLLQPESKLLQHEAFYSLVESVARYTESKGFARVGLLASPTTMRTGLYDRTLTKYGIKSLTPTTDEYSTIENAIRNVIDGKQSVKDSEALARVSARLRKDGAEAIILGCTELPLAFDKELIDFPTVDCLDVYATVTTRRYYLYNGE